MSDMIIRFYEILKLLIEHPEAKREIGWRIRFFEREVNSIEEISPLYAPARRMLEEIAICQRRRRSRRSHYNASMIDWIYGSYMVSHSPNVLYDAWNNFCTEAYKIA